MKLEWKKTEKDIYLPGKSPVLVTVPKMIYVTVKGRGNPNAPAFADTIQLLYSFSYGIKMMPKSGHTPPGYEEYAVYPLEATWSIQSDWDEQHPLDKDELDYTAMIRQPSFVTDEVFALAAEKVAKKKLDLPVEKASLTVLEEGLCVQLLHIGSYDDEPASFAKLHDFMAENKLKRRGEVHREIYLSDPRKVAPDKLRTVLRYQVEAI